MPFILKSSLIISMLFTVLNSYGQISSVANFIKGGKNDASKIISAYILPIEKALSYNGANSNILYFNTKDKLTFGIGLDFTVSKVHTKEYNFDLNALNLQQFEPSDTRKTELSTISGSTKTASLETKIKYLIPSTKFPFYSEKPVLKLNSPQGKDQTLLPLSLIHLFAAKKGNMISLKILPPFKINDGQFRFFDIGVNVQHQLGSSIPFFNDLWVDFYLSTGYNYNSVIYYLDIKPNEKALTFSFVSDNGPYNNQEFEVSSISIPLKLTVAKSFHNLSIFTTIGYNILQIHEAMSGIYPVYYTNLSNKYQIIVNDIKNPINTQKDFSRGSLDIGINYNSNHFTWGLKYTYMYYQNLSMSMGYTL